ncbi:MULTISPECIES: 50S ribosomal protein L6 [Thiorhodovibrio]|jgi:large subunit ribosomal protein L6|uniref:50S ribosomal protein L6 n=1 Tax=Thiorhodovibrio TaxID=61593 RepID=UPI001914B875|nr:MULTISPECIES: 50S ribosomal protein L6 [Thiorhodovibrio]MBK5968182.1 50S ribosomal protein L6 [Thiorhodovibrio winogradskyi]WPL13601.1 50S ribosomal protein L6 [Thiorhodovibrio litoralis]
MSRIAKWPVTLPSGVNVDIKGQSVTVKGSKGTLSWDVHPLVSVELADGQVRTQPTADDKKAWALAGTTRALINNMVVGVSSGFERRLALVGVGYRAQAKGKTLNLALGFSHPVDYPVPQGIEIETPSPTEIIVRGADKQQVGQVAAKIRRYRPPEPYKGKGVRYADEDVLRKEAKKK